MSDQQQHMTKTEAHPYHRGRGIKVFDPNCPLCRDDQAVETTYVGWSLHEKIVKSLTAERDEALKYGAPKDDVALSWVKNPCKRHNQYWTTASGSCMACRADSAEARAVAAEKRVAVLANTLEQIELLIDDWRATKSKQVDSLPASNVLARIGNFIDTARSLICAATDASAAGGTT